MVNLHSLKKRRVNVGKLIVKARNERRYRSIERLEIARDNLNRKIKVLRSQKPKKK